MYLSSKLLENAVQQNQDGYGLIVDLSLKQLIGLKGIEKYLEPDQIDKLLLSTNYLQNIDQNFHLFVNLRELDLSINHIPTIENLESLVNLRLLNLSNNRITKIENLDALKSLEVLDLSMNYIERIQNLKNKSIKTLILSGNNINELENLYHLKQLQNLEIEKNSIENINNLAIFGCKDLKKISFGYNKIPVSYFDDLLMLLESFQTLEEVNFVGNEVAAHKLYRAKIMQFPHIKVLDKLVIRDPIKKHFEALRQDHEIKDLVEKTKEEYMERMAIESKLKFQALDMIEKQRRQIEEVFEEHQNNLQDDMMYFFNRAQEFQEKKLQGQNLAVTDKILDSWKESVQKKEIERKTAFDEALRKQKQTEKEYLENQINSKKFNQKLYEISMKNPEVWKDIKLKEQQTYNNEELLAQKMKQMQMDNALDEEEARDYQELANQIQINMIKDVANAVIDYEAQELQQQREKAANVLKHALLKQMVNHYTAVKGNNKPVNEEGDEEEYEETNPETDIRNVNNTEDQLKEILHSRVYKDGEWKTLKKKDQGPRDLSERSLGELLYINPNGEPSGTKRSSNKKKTKQQGNMIQEEEDDEDYNEYNRQPQQRRSQKIRSSQFNDLERDPFEGDGRTYYDDAYVVGEQDGQKVLLIPFENSNVLDGISTLNGQKKRESEAYASPLERQSTTSPTKPKGKKKKKKKKELNNLLAELEQEQMNNNEPKQKSLVIPEYQLMNRPYATLNKENDQPKQEKRVMFQEMDIPGPQEEYEGSLVREREEEQHANQLPGQKQQKDKQKSKYCNIF